MRMESKWCPECEGYYEHIDGLCISCDLEPEMWKGKTLDEIDVSGATGKTHSWKDEAWVVTTVKEPIYAADTKSDAVRYVEEETGISSISTTRIRPGLYQWETHEEVDGFAAEVFFIGRPEAFMKEDLESVLQPTDSH